MIMTAATSVMRAVGEIATTFKGPNVDNGDGNDEDGYINNDDNNNDDDDDD